MIVNTREDILLCNAHIAQNGELANSRVGAKGEPAVDGEMDFVRGAKQEIFIS